MNKIMKLYDTIKYNIIFQMDGHAEEELINKSDEVIIVRKSGGFKLAVEILMFTFYFGKTLSGKTIKLIFVFSVS